MVYQYDVQIMKPKLSISKIYVLKLGRQATQTHTLIMNNINGVKLTSKPSACLSKPVKYCNFFILDLCAESRFDMILHRKLKKIKDMYKACLKKLFWKILKKIKVVLERF